MLTTHRAGSLALFLMVTVGGGLAIGYLTAPGEWYASLVKPAFSPPNWVFAPVWSLLYVLIAIAGWRTFESERSGHRAKLWWTQIALNFLWSPTFFGAQMIGLALLVILLLLVTILSFVAKSWRKDSLSAFLFLPYAAWVAFASILNAALWYLN